MSQYQHEYVKMTQKGRIKALAAELESFKSGEKYVELQERFDSLARGYEKRIAGLERELKEQKAINDKNLKKAWKDVDEAFGTLENKRIRELESMVRSLKKKLKEKEKQIDELKKELETTKLDLEEEKGKNLKLNASNNLDYTNSSQSSSLSPNHKKIVCNSRIKTGRKPGGQPGHKGNGRTRQNADEKVKVDPPQEVKENPDNYEKTGETKVRQVIGIRLVITATDYVADVYRNIITGKKIYGKFPDCVVNDVNYDGSVKALAYLLNNDCNVSIDKTIELISNLTDGKLNISKGFVNGLSGELSSKTEKERTEIFNQLVQSRIVHIDNTNARVNGESRFVFFTGDPSGPVQYDFRRNKGFEGMKGTPLESNSTAVVVQDHEKTFYHYGSEFHQECIAHTLRCCKGSMVNEPHLTWNKLMFELLQEMVHYRNIHENDAVRNKDEIQKLEDRYDAILKTAESEYEENLPSKYYREGINLSVRLKEYRQSVLLFLHDFSVPHNNNFAERALRGFKRKQRQVMSFRSDASAAYLCDGLTFKCYMLNNEEGNFFKHTSEVFNRKKSGSKAEQQA